MLHILFNTENGFILLLAKNIVQGTIIVLSVVPSVWVKEKRYESGKLGGRVLQALLKSQVANRRCSRGNEKRRTCGKR